MTASTGLTGSAAWLHRAAIETLIGLTVEPGRIRLAPCLPAHWPFVELSLKLQGHVIALRWQRAGEPLPADLDDALVVAESQWIALDEMPAEARILVQGSPAPAASAEGALPDSDVPESLLN